jgi:hypothetical protein
VSVVGRDLNLNETNPRPLCSLDQELPSIIAQFALEGYLSLLGAEPDVVQAFHHLTPPKLRVSTLRDDFPSPTCGLKPAASKAT